MIAFLISIISIILIVAAVVFLSIKSSRNKKTAPNKNGFIQKRIMTSNEIEFLHRLTGALPGFYVFPQVAMGAIIKPDVKGDNREYFRLRGKFSQKIIDYIVCDKEMKIIAIVELDDKTHNSKRDKIRDDMVGSAGYRCIRWNSKNKPNEKIIKKTILGGTAQPDTDS